MHNARHVNRAEFIAVGQILNSLRQFEAPEVVSKISSVEVLSKENTPIDS